MKQGSVITIDIGASKIRFAVVDARKELTEYPDVSPINLVGLGLDNKKLVAILIDGIKKCSAALAGEKNIPLAISIGAAGQVDSDTGVIKIMPNLKNIKNLNVGQELKNEFNLPIFLLNDADAGAIGEHWLGSGVGFENIVYIPLGTGVGSGIIVKGKLQPGLELGHEPLAVKSVSRTCVCGNSNDVESFLGTRGLAEIYGEVFEVKISDLNDKKIQSISPKMRAGVNSGDEKWLAVQDKYSEYLVLFLENIISAYKPEAIILGGGIAYGNEPLSETTREKLTGTKETKILLAQLKNAVNWGAAKYASDKLNWTA